MIKFKEFNESLKNKDLTEEIQDKIVLLMYMSENEDMINESYDLENLTEAQEEMIVEGINNWLEKVGMKLHKGDGILDYLLQFGKGIGKLIMAGIKRDEKRVKEIASEFTKEKVIDFLLKLDMATMHIVTGPIHFIDAITGWDLMSNLKHAAEDAKDKLKSFYKAMKNVKDSIASVLGGHRQKNMMRVATNLEYNMPDIK
jgi:hypothetical protein